MSRPWEVLVTVVLLVLLSPLLLLGALTVLLTSGRPVLFRQQRVGQGGTSFTLLKLRTMPVGTSGHAVTVAGATRVSGVARLLRAS